MASTTTTTTKKKKTVVFAPVIEEHQKKVVMSRDNLMEDVILLLNPLYLHLYDKNEWEPFLKSLGFKLIERGKIILKPKEARDIFRRRYKDSKYWEDLINHFSGKETAYYHVCQLNAYKEIDLLLRRYFTNWPEVFEYRLIETPLLTKNFALTFIPMDSAQMYEDCLKAIYPDARQYWGQDLVRYNPANRNDIINRILMSTVGDSMKHDFKNSQPMIKELFYNPKESKSLHYVTTTPKQGIFEVRVQNKYGSLSDPKKVERKRNQLLDKFHSLSMYYTRLCEITDDHCPSFYRFKICPDSLSKLYRVYEVEEHAGEQFMYQVLKEVEQFRKHETRFMGGLSSVTLSKQGSLPAYVFGYKLAKLAEQLQELRYRETSAVGRMRFDGGQFIASTPIDKFYQAEKEYFYWLLEETRPLVKRYFNDRVSEYTRKIENLLASHTFKESRKAEYIRLVPDRIDPMNLRIYNKSEFVTDKFLKELEVKLNVELESIAREKFFQGIDAGLDYSLFETYERLKLDDEEFKDPEVALKEAKTRLLEDKHSSGSKRLGSFWEDNHERIQQNEDYQRSEAVKDITKSWLEDESEVGIPDLTDQRQDVVDKKGVAVSGITPAKYTKEHWAAGIYFFINFIMGECKREELIKAKILTKEEDFDQTIKSLTSAFQKNYQYFDATHKPPKFLEDEFELEKHYKDTEKQKRHDKMSKQEEEEHKRYLRSTCSPEEALKMVAEEMHHKNEERRNIIREGYVIRDDARIIRQIDKDKGKNKFLRVAEHGIIGQTHLGPTLEDEVEAVMTKYQDQVIFNDKISFFRMEYFLYCLRELHRMDEDSKFLNEDVEYYLRKFKDKDEELNRLRYSYARATPEEKTHFSKLEKETKRLRKKMQDIDREASMKVIQIKKLIKHMLDWRIKAKNVYGGDHYGIPLDTFWIPLDMRERVDTDYDKEEYRLDLVEEIKKRIAHEHMKPDDPKLIKKIVEDMTAERKHVRTMLGYYAGTDENEELVFKKLEPLAERTTNEILSVVPDIIRETFRNI